MGALDQIAEWPVDTASAAIVDAAGEVVEQHGSVDSEFRLASLTKVFVGWAAMIAVEEGGIALDYPVGQAGCTLEHLLSHAGGYPFEGREPVSAPGERRIYSNAGFELAAEVIVEATGLAFEDYLADGVLGPLGLRHSDLRGSVAHGLWSTVDDVANFLFELQQPTLLSPAGAAAVVQPHYPDLGGIVPGVGRFEECPWGLGAEIRGAKWPHWTGRHNSQQTFGHFGGSGTMMWVDPVAGGAVVALTDRPFDQWSTSPVAAWSRLSDDVVAVLEAAQ